MKAYASGPNSALACICMATIRLLPKKHPRNLQGCMNLILSGPVHKASKSHAFGLLKTCCLFTAAAAVARPLHSVHHICYLHHLQWVVGACLLLCKGAFVVERHQDRQAAHHETGRLA